LSLSLDQRASQRKSELASKPAFKPATVFLRPKGRAKKSKNREKRHREKRRKIHTKGGAAAQFLLCSLSALLLQCELDARCMDDERPKARKANKLDSNCSQSQGAELSSSEMLIIIIIIIMGGEEIMAEATIFGPVGARAPSCAVHLLPSCVSAATESVCLLDCLSDCPLDCPSLRVGERLRERLADQETEASLGQMPPA